MLIGNPPVWFLARTNAEVDFLADSYHVDDTKSYLGTILYPLHDHTLVDGGVLPTTAADVVDTRGWAIWNIRKLASAHELPRTLSHVSYRSRVSRWHKWVLVSCHQCQLSPLRLPISWMVFEHVSHWLIFAEGHHPIRSLALGFTDVRRCPACLKTRVTSCIGFNPDYTGARTHNKTPVPRTLRTHK